MSDRKNNILYLGLRVPKMMLGNNSRVALFHHPTIRIQYDAQIDGSRLNTLLAEDCYYVFLSRNGVVGLDSWLRTTKQSISFQDKRVWSVGGQTASEVRLTFGVASEEPKKQNAGGLIQVFNTLKPRAVVIFCAEDLRPEFPEWLKANGWEHNLFPVYETFTVQNEDLANRFANHSDESVIFTSPSTVRGFLKSIGRRDLKGIVAKLFSIGPSTSKEIDTWSGKVHQEASEPDIDRFLNTIVNELGQ